MSTNKDNEVTGKKSTGEIFTLFEILGIDRRV